MTTQKVGKVVRIITDQSPPIELVVSLGSTDGVSMRDTFLIYAIGDEIKDPETGESLGQLEIVRGRGKAKHVQPSMTTVTALTRRKQVIRKVRPSEVDPFTLFHQRFPDEIVEETDEEIPFEAVTVGDLVRVI